MAAEGDPPLDYHALFESMPGLYVVLDPSFVIVAVSNAYLSATMASRSEVVGRGLFDVFPGGVDGSGANRARNVRTSLQRVVDELVPNTLSVRRYDLPLPEEAGGGTTARYWSVHNAPVLDAEGRLAYLVHRIDDVTGHTRLADAVAEAEGMRLFFESIVENIPSMIFVKDAEDLRFVRFNRAVEDLYGVGQYDLVGKGDSDLFPPEQAEEYIRADRDILAGRRPSDLTEATIQTPTLGPRIVRTRKVPLLDEAGQPKYLLGISEDVTESREAAAKLAEINEAMTESLRTLERRNEEMVCLNELGELLQACLDSSEAWGVIAHGAARLFPGCTGALSIMRPSRNLLEVLAVWGDWPDEERLLDPGACWALRRGRRYESGTSGPPCAHLQASGRTDAICVPMVAQGETLGVLHLLPAVDGGWRGGDRRDGTRGTDDGREGDQRAALARLATMASEQIGLAIANLDLRDRLRRMSIRDPLTNLYNRRYMEETLERELERARRTGDELSVIQLDIDRFKSFNDTHGHEAGDVVLQAIAEVLQGSVRNDDVACRYGGEELTLILPGMSLDAADVRATSLLDRFRELVIPYRGSVLPAPTASMGVAVFPLHGTTPDALLRSADGALYLAKGAGRDRVVRAPAAEPVASRHGPRTPASGAGPAVPAVGAHLLQAPAPDVQAP